ncbi:phosphodiester glycosidase family protein [Salinibacterium sp. NK8237]|uniref:phosphodiester glycosidase family protein n=1 Tax=Salinibacterium sp. NK8237 TaxID=2792038 RepID=UPI0018CF72FF|nr:phosphodiester glycosidase family protein [Salinibacterium sp. NK8237]MBH0129361.1 phosphodiester glycosidase family protein [Salinibacterium sp. NK8237]
MRKKPLRKRHIVIGSVLVLVLGLGSTAAWALDRFVIEHVEISDVAQYEADNSTTTTSTEPTAAATTEPVLTDTSYTSDDANVTISTVVSGSGADTVTYYVADVELTDATALRSAFAQNSFGENIIDLTSSIAAEHDAIFAINGDYYGFRDTGIVIRNGVTYRDEPARDGLAFYLDGSVEVYDETTTSADELIADGVWNTLSFGPAIVEDGDVVAGIENVEIDTNFGNHSIQGEQPRTAVGVIDDNHLVFVVVDGRDPGYSAGVTLPDLAVIMQDLGATTAYNLDGGGSSTMYFNGTVINQPSNGGERETSDILYVGAAS